jgi:general secretion pathway protein D
MHPQASKSHSALSHAKGHARLRLFTAILSLSLTSCSLQPSTPNPNTQSPLPPPRSANTDSHTVQSSPHPPNTFPLSPPTTPTTRAPLSHAAVPPNSFRLSIPDPSTPVAPDSSEYTPLPAKSVDAASESDTTPIYFDFDNADIRDAIPLILGELLRVPYFIHPSVSGPLTVRTTTSISRSQALHFLQNALAAQNIAFVETDGVFLVLPASLVSAPQSVLTEFRDSSQTQHPDIISLEHMDAHQILSLLTGIGVPSSHAVPIPSSNRILLRGSPSERAALRSFLSAIDVPWLAGRHVHIERLRYASASSVADELTTIFTSTSPNDASFTRIIPLERINAIVVLGASTQQLDHVRQTINYLDWLDPASRSATFSYRPHHIPPSKLAALLTQAITHSDTNRSHEHTSSVPSPSANLSRLIAESDLFPLDLSAGPALHPDSISLLTSSRATSVLYDDDRDTILVIGNLADLELARTIVERFDVARAQVLVEATILEVLLNDTLRYGIEWSFSTGRLSGGFGFPDRSQNRSLEGGLSLLFAAPSATAVLEALSTITDVRVLSAPHLVVMSGEEASLVVGDQVPVPISTIVDDRDDGTRIITTNEFRDTGITFNIRPEVGVDGAIRLDIKQSISATVPNSTSASETPAFHQRIVETRVVVEDSVTLALGGLIREQRVNGTSGVPVLARVPIIGYLFSRTEEIVSRTELLILIKTRVVKRDMKYTDTLMELRSGFVEIMRMNW